MPATKIDILAPLPYEGRQSAPHGSTVADIILTIAPRVKLYSADVFGPQGGCEVETVIRALQHCIDVWNGKIVNLSLGVPEHRLQQVQRRVQFQRAIEEAYFKDVLVFGVRSVKCRVVGSRLGALGGRGDR